MCIARSRYLSSLNICGILGILDGLDHSYSLDLEPPHFMWANGCLGGVLRFLVR